MLWAFPPYIKENRTILIYYLNCTFYKMKVFWNNNTAVKKAGADKTAPENSQPTPRKTFILKRPILRLNSFMPAPPRATSPHRPNAATPFFKGITPRFCR